MDAENISILTRRLSDGGKLNGREFRLVEAVTLLVRDVPADQDIAREGSRPTSCMLLVEGLAARYRTLADGRRQILSFHIAGDFLDLQGYTLQRLDHSIGTLTASRIVTFPHTSVTEMLGEPNLMRIFWRETLIEAAICREWLVNVGRRSAYQRVAHVLCELVTRMNAVGLAHDGICDLPLTQSELADATGLSAVHVNRIIQELRRENLIALRNRTFSALNWDGLKFAAEFDASYLHLGAPQPTAPI